MSSFDTLKLQPGDLVLWHGTHGFPPAYPLLHHIRHITGNGHIVIEETGQEFNDDGQLILSGEVQSYSCCPFITEFNQDAISFIRRKTREREIKSVKWGEVSDAQLNAILFILNHNDGVHGFPQEYKVEVIR